MSLNDFITSALGGIDVHSRLRWYSFVQDWSNGEVVLRGKPDLFVTSEAHEMELTLVPALEINRYRSQLRRRWTLTAGLYIRVTTGLPVPEGGRIR